MLITLPNYYLSIFLLTLGRPALCVQRIVLFIHDAVWYVFNTVTVTHGYTRTARARTHTHREI